MKNSGEIMGKTRVQCKKCKRFFIKDICDIENNFEIIHDKENNPKGFCYRCLDNSYKNNSTDERLTKYGDKSSTNLSQHKHNYI